MELGLFQKDALIEKLAQVFYRIQGYTVPQNYRMQNSTHPAEKACVAMALVAIEEVEFELAGDGDAEVIKWQQGQSLGEDRQFYFCRYEEFALTLLTSPAINTTRVEVTCGNRKLYISEKEITKEQATEELQDFLTTLAAQLQTLSRIQFEENL
ncbi:MULTISPECIES: hypothetical protein [Nostoc]|uniref:Uncharacterized protein n=1 Tax=Nostoc paludosum FACHB-159 TaxID=2692908 RepID=A0ABR8KJA2_9NOSO|nr:MULTISPECIES: hypothetical protein [Nostoc]MBD2683337.1 hypothetical protein [Nostoc sp. FACHB-857]MBD2739654.1 hypothetical protein [Nostoc paludosum FACHB-159]